MDSGVRVRQVVKPGVVCKPEKPLRVTVLDRALDDELRVRVGDADPGADENGTPPVAGTAPAVRLIEGQPGSEGHTGTVSVPVTSVNTADYQVTGAALRRKAYQHPLVGLLELHQENFAPPDGSGMELLVLSAAPGSPAEDGLRLLAGLDACPTANAQVRE